MKKLLAFEVVELSKRWGNLVDYIVVEFTDQYIVKYCQVLDDFSPADVDPQPYHKMPIILSTSDQSILLNEIKQKIPFRRMLTIKLIDYPPTNDKNWFLGSGIDLLPICQYDGYNDKACSNAIAKGLDSLTGKS